ncbi:hypothetical protein [Komagataeibacter xylinus]|uniref:hypothetical protein n=1 Tax=Komagataeibacter xylinus TaxID=28448 RepID=UPI000FDF77AE|nr:hypothetical protein [Komagataeibacter xylinus]AZV39950.1 hypothetical protein CXP35_15420 [Komagataeibacter xylinus]
MTETKTETELYVVPGRLTDEEETNMRSKLLGGPILGPADMFSRMVGIVGTPIQPCADVETVCVALPEFEVKIDAVGATLVYQPHIKSPNGHDVELVRRDDMEARVAHLVAEIARLRVVEGEMHMLEEVCAFYANDEDRFIKADGNAEPYGMIPTNVGMKARSARVRFMAREKAAQAAGG